MPSCGNRHASFPFFIFFPFFCWWAKWKEHFFNKKTWWWATVIIQVYFFLRSSLCNCIYMWCWVCDIENEKFSLHHFSFKICFATCCVWVGFTLKLCVLLQWTLLQLSFLMHCFKKILLKRKILATLWC